MSFLQPAILLALPVIALPIVIHLINQRRFQTVPWAAMRFLLAANRMSRGYARLRQWLILAARTLAIAGLLFAISRPLSSGLLGFAGGAQVDTTIILLDRSPSMSQVGPGGVSKRESAIAQVVQSLERLPSSRYVLVESSGLQAMEIESPEQLLDMVESAPVSETADLPSMLEVAYEYIRLNRPSRCEMWICSDVRRADWKDESGRWGAVRNAFLELPQMLRIHLLAYPELDPNNRSIRVTRVRRVDSDNGAQLLLSLRVEQSVSTEGPVRIPIQMEIDGGRSEFSAEMSGSVLELRDHIIPIESNQEFGWGRVSIPSDACPADNEFYFVYDREPERRTLIVSDSALVSQPLQFAASVSADPSVICSARSVTRDDLLVGDFDDVSLVVWQQQIPSVGDPAREWLKEVADRGGRLLFLPPENPSGERFAGVAWSDWSGETPARVASWMGDRDLLANTRSGEALPVGELSVMRRCEIQGEFTGLATLDNGQSLLVRAATDGGNVYFCGTTPDASDSKLASGGVVLYAMIHRALEAGSESLGNARQFDAGAVAIGNDGQWRRVSGADGAVSSRYQQHAGVFEAGERIFAVNRSVEEDEAEIVADDRVASLFRELDFNRVDEQLGSGSVLVREIWRLFLVAMLIALLVEAALCIPKRSVAESKPSFAGAET